MEKIFVGKVVSTHGIKGELRIISNFEFPNKAFKVDTNLIIDDKKYKIVSYRVHKNYHMVKFLGFDDINEVLFLKGKKAYKEKVELELNDDEVLDSDLINFKVYTQDNKSGIITEIFYASDTNKILRIQIDGREILIPVNSPFIKKINSKEETVEIELIEGM